VLKELVDEKTKGHTVVAKAMERPAGGKVIDLMDALKRSIEGRRRGRGRALAAAKSGHKSFS
jgi:non-homologous end joining protein Ku